MYCILRLTEEGRKEIKQLFSVGIDTVNIAPVTGVCLLFTDFKSNPGWMKHILNLEIYFDMFTDESTAFVQSYSIKNKEQMSRCGRELVVLLVVRKWQDLSKCIKVVVALALFLTL